MSIEHTQQVMESYWSGHGREAVAEDAVFKDMASGLQWRGREAVADMLRTYYTELFAAEFIPDHVHIADGSAAVEGRFIGKHIGEFAGVPATGKDVDVPLAVFYRVEERGITEGRVWFMVSCFLEQVG
jgi:steroid delta-isomerase-like uncharacterized protein